MDESLEQMLGELSERDLAKAYAASERDNDEELADLIALEMERRHPDG